MNVLLVYQILIGLPHMEAWIQILVTVTLRGGILLERVFHEGNVQNYHNVLHRLCWKWIIIKKMITITVIITQLSFFLRRKSPDHTKEKCSLVKIWVFFIENCFFFFSLREANNLKYLASHSSDSCRSKLTHAFKAYNLQLKGIISSIVWEL